MLSIYLRIINLICHIRSIKGSDLSLPPPLIGRPKLSLAFDDVAPRNGNGQIKSYFRDPKRPPPRFFDRVYILRMSICATIFFLFSGPVIASCILLWFDSVVFMIQRYFSRSVLAGQRGGYPDGRNQQSLGVIQL